VRSGIPLPARVKSVSSVLILEPTLGVDSSQPSVDAPLGSTPRSSNYIMREGALEPRPMLTLRGSSPHILGNVPVLGGQELISVGQTRYPVISSTTRMAVYGQTATPNGWSVLSYVSANGIDAPPNLAVTEYWDAAQIYSATRDENWGLFAAGSYQTMYVTQSDTTVFSTLTGAPRAKFVASLDNYVMAFNLREGSADYVQRCQWSDRGSPTFTGGLSGFEDLLSAKGEGKRVMVQDNRFILFFDEEIWQGVQGNNVFPWQFAPYDTSRGCPYSWTIASTPLGLIFLGKDYQVYLLPKGGGQSQPIGQRLHRTIRDQIDQPGRAWAVYNNTLGQYQLYYPIQGGSGYPQRGVYLDINTGAWAPMSFDENGGNLSLTRGFEVVVSSSATTYGGAGAAGLRYADVGMTYAQMGGASEQRSVLVGSSKGTTYTFSSNATSDNGTAVPCYWQSTGIAGMDPTKQKTVREWRVDYQGDSSSSLTVRFTTNLGGSFGNETQVNLPATSGMSQAIAYPYFSARYPAFEIRSEGQRHRINRFYLEYRESGR
jgi:hypothetical protein